MEDQSAALHRTASLPNFEINQPAGDSLAETGVPPRPTRARTIAITSGKGGVGKTNVAVNLAAALAARRQRVTLVDADLGLANVDVLCGLNPQWHIGHVLTGERTVREITIQTWNGVRLIPGGSGVTSLTNLSQGQNRQLVAELRAVEDESEFILIDTAAGIAPNVTGILAAATETIVVSTPDPASIIDAYAVIKVLHQQSPINPIWIIINNAADPTEAEQAYTQIHAAAAHFLNRPIEHLGTVPHDPNLVRAVREQIPVVDYMPQTLSSRAFHLIARSLDRSPFRSAGTEGVQAFWSLVTNGFA